MIAVGGNVKIYANDELIRQGHNLVVNDGLDWVSDLMGGNGIRASHIGLGTGVSAETATDTAIQTEQYRDVITRRDKLAQAIEFQLFVPQANGNGFSYTEAGLLVTGQQNINVNDPATLIARFTFAPILKTSSVELTFLWTVNLTAS